MSWTARADLAEADAVLLTSDKPVDGSTQSMVASAAVTLEEVARLASELTGREIRRVVLTDEAWRDEKVAQGVPAAMADLLLGTFHAARRGDFASTDCFLANLLGRSPLTMRDVLAKHIRRPTLQH